jgi:uncharacterized protein YjbJ (UPF0337 family)
MRKRGWIRWRGRVKREIGEATGDRRVEAEGAIEASLGRAPDPRELDRAERAVRRRHGDIPDRAMRERVRRDLRRRG